MLGGLAASGWHTCGLMMRMMCDGFLLNSVLDGRRRRRRGEMAQAGAAGRPLTLRVTVSRRAPRTAAPEMGFVTTLMEMFNQAGNARDDADRRPLMFGTRRATPHDEIFRRHPVGDRSRARHVSFHRRRDQELSPRASTRSPFMSTRRKPSARISASCAPRAGTPPSMWMRTMVDYRRREADARARAGRAGRQDRPLARLPRSEMVEAGLCRRHDQLMRPKWSKRGRRTAEPDWGIMRVRNTGTNQNGELVISFVSTTFVERRPAA